MSLAWPDEDFADNREEEWDGHLNTADDFEDDAGKERLWCAGVLAWMQASTASHPLRKHSIRSRPVWFGAPDPDFVACRWWSEPSRTRAGRLWEVLTAIESAVGELDASPLPPERDREVVARSLEVLADSLARLERALPTPDDGSEFYELDDGKRAVHVDWQEINRKQAVGLPHGLLSEEGVELAPISRVTAFNVYAEELEPEGPLFE